VQTDIFQPMPALRLL